MTATTLLTLTTVADIVGRFIAMDNGTGRVIGFVTAATRTNSGREMRLEVDLDPGAPDVPGRVHTYAVGGQIGLASHIEVQQWQAARARATGAQSSPLWKRHPYILVGAVFLLSLSVLLKAPLLSVLVVAFAVGWFAGRRHRRSTQRRAL